MYDTLHCHTDHISFTFCVEGSTHNSLYSFHINSSSSSSHLPSLTKPWSATYISSKLLHFCRALKQSSADFNANLIHHGHFNEFESLTSELSSTDKRHHSDTHLDLNPTATYLDETSAIHITEAVHNFLGKPINPHSDRGSSLQPQEPLTQTLVTFPFNIEPDNTYFGPDSSGPEIAFKKSAERELDTLIEDV